MTKRGLDEVQIQVLTTRQSSLLVNPGHREKASGELNTDGNEHRERKTKVKGKHPHLEARRSEIDESN